MHATMIVEHRVDRRLALDQDQAGPGRIEKGHAAVPHGLQMSTADYLRIEPRACCDIADRNAEMGNALDRNHVVLPWWPLPVIPAESGNPETAGSFGADPGPPLSRG